MTERNAIYDLSGRHLRPEAIIPYPGRRLSARGVTTIGTTRRGYRHNPKVRGTLNAKRIPGPASSVIVTSATTATVPVSMPWKSMQRYSLNNESSIVC